MPATYGFNLSSVSSIDIPITCRPFLAYLFWNSINQGISILQGPHHVAQKSRRMTLPLNADSFTSLLLRSFSVKLRFAGLAFAGQLAAPAAPPPSPVADASWSSDGHGSAGNVSSASASAPTVAIVHRIFMRILRARLIPAPLIPTCYSLCADP